MVTAVPPTGAKPFKLPYPGRGLPTKGTVTMRPYGAINDGTITNEYVYLAAPPNDLVNAKDGTEFWGIPLVKMVKEGPAGNDLFVRKNLQHEYDGKRTPSNSHNTFKIIKP